MEDPNKLPAIETAAPSPDRKVEDTQRGYEIFSGLKQRIGAGWNKMKESVGKLNIGKKVEDFAARTVGGAVNSGERNLDAGKKKGAELLQRGGEIATRGFDKMNASREAFGDKLNVSVEAFNQRLADRQIDKRYTGDISSAVAELQHVTEGGFMAEERARLKQGLVEAYAGNNADAIQAALEKAQEAEAELPGVVLERTRQVEEQINKLRATVARAKQAYGTPTPATA